MNCNCKDCYKLNLKQQCLFMTFQQYFPFYRTSLTKMSKSSYYYTNHVYAIIII